MALKHKEILEQKTVSYEEFKVFIQSNGVGKIKTKHLDQIIDNTNGQVLFLHQFDSWYNIVSTNDANKTMKCWTITTGIFTIIVTAATIANLIIMLTAP